MKKSAKNGLKIIEDLNPLLNKQI